MAKRLPQDPKKVQAILKAALHEFAVHGFDRASTDQIAAEAGVSKGLIFRYFSHKKNLYIQTVNQALTTMVQVADFDVWRDAPDLVHMIIQATQYKLELAQQYPDEFTLLLAVYRQDNQIPVELRQQVFDIFDQWAKANVNNLVDPVIKRLNLRPELDPADVKTFLQLFINQISQITQEYMQAHPQVKTLADMSELIQRIESYMDMMEHGIIAH
ncbi:TetR/AcrR family transcriptional regulator [Agrilactobacillus fermenti]|uniref:TetR/AcrR family transcriptional regulator n=1 Tax=Agrilactobacillus fermenti TaxID=2586909 RepID=UPI001E453177|nr:TetR/AcrR family transcriptional regulator [Agrilactobacillus fermenti]MCD2256280.1 TetR family transcriptional regulator [Agrilactobacillus fermenti]